VVALVTYGQQVGRPAPMGVASKIYTANPVMFNDLRLQLPNNGGLVDELSEFELYCQQPDVTANLYKFVKCK